MGASLNCWGSPDEANGENGQRLQPAQSAKAKPTPEGRVGMALLAMCLAAFFCILLSNWSAESFFTENTTWWHWLCRLLRGCWSYAVSPTSLKTVIALDQTNLENKLRKQRTWVTSTCFSPASVYCWWRSKIVEDQEVGGCRTGVGVAFLTMKLLFITVKQCNISLADSTLNANV